MAHSKRKTPIRGVATDSSEKQDKQLANRRYRRGTRGAIRTWSEADVLPHLRELTDPWCMSKDGKFRFDPKQFPEYMRK